MAEANFRLPPELNILTGNIAENFRKWKRQLEVYLEASGGSAKPNKTQTAIILHCAGPQVLEVYDHLKFEDDHEKIDPKKVLEKLHEYCNPRSSEVLETYRFWNTPVTDPFDAFVTELRTRADKCNFKEKDRMIRDKIVFSVDKKLQEKLLREQDLSLSKTIAIGQSFEQTNNHLQEMSTKIDKVHVNRQRERQSNPVSAGDGIRQKNKTINNCKFCGRSHEFAKEKCFAWGKTCSNCNGRNHFAAKCKKSKTVKLATQNDHAEEEDSSCEEEWLHAVNAKKERMTALLRINDRDVRFQVDTGADVNIICKKHVRREQTSKTNQTLTMWNKTKVKPVGKAVLKVTNPKTKETKGIQFTVVENNFSCLLSFKASTDLGLITVNEDKFIAKLENAEIESIGDLGEVTLKVDPTVKPTALPSRKIPHALKDRVKEEIDTLLDRGILEKVDEPTDWVSQMVVVKKPSGAIRICIDPQPLNKALCREHFKLPTFDDILPELQNAKVFSKLDIQEAYWHIRLDEESSKLTTMATPLGFRVRWKRLPFGLKVSSEIFQRKLTEALQGLDGCVNVADDIVIAGSGDTKQEAHVDHDKKLKNLKARCQEKKIRLNDSKSKFRQSEITFMGHKISEKGIAPSEDKIKAILDTQPPNDVHGVRRFCGMVQYLARFLNNLSETLTPIRELTKKNAEFNWTTECDKAFQEIKSKITQTPVLAYYDPERPLEIQVDSSKDAMGAALMQDGRPIEFASRKLTDTQKRWAQIEKEMMAVVFGMERFDQYTFGRKVTIINDHKPLEQILKKPLNQAPMRLQKLLMRSNRYDFDFKWIHGSQLVIADYLSRDCRSPPAGDADEDADCRQISSSIPDVMIDKVKYNTSRDPTLQSLIATIQEGWPESKNQLPTQLMIFFDFRDTLSIDDGIILKGERILIPANMRQEIKEKLHAAHLAYDSMMRRAKQTVFWPGMPAEIKTMAEKCELCQALKPANQKETLTQHDQIMEPWEKIGCDLMEISGRHYLITVDYFSNFIEADFLPTTTAEAVVSKLKAHFARFGVPKIVMTDGGPQFSAQGFKTFEKKWAFKHMTSSPGHPKSNGRAESAVKIIKGMMKKALQQKQDQYEALLELRNTPRQHSESPAQLMLKRRLRTLLPCASNPLRNEARENLTKRRMSVASQYNKNAKNLPPLCPDQPVYYQNPQQQGWNRGRITKDMGNRRYVVEGEAGGTYHRNRVHLRPRLTPFQAQDENDDDFNRIPQPDGSTGSSHEENVVQPSNPTNFKGEDNGSRMDTSGGQINNPSPETEPRPKRNIKQPTWMKDFVVTK